MQDSVEVGPLTVFFPTGSLRSFWFAEDLTEMFGLEVNSEAEHRLRKALREHPKGRLGFDHEGDAVTVNASNPVLMRHVLEVVRGLCLDPEILPIPAIEAAFVAMQAAPKPKRQRWEIGNIFAVPLADGTWTFGQVVDSPGPELGATLALYEFRRPEPAITAEMVEDIVTSRTLTILHTTSAAIEDGRFHVVGTGPILVDPAAGSQGPRERGHSWDGIESVANAWYGLSPWNDCYDEDFLDRRIMAGLKRPPTAWVLTPEEREELRSQKDWSARSAILAELIRKRTTP